MNDERRGPQPIAAAMEWVAKITTVGLEMALPAIGGGWLDRRLGTSYWALIGVALGVTVGIWHLIQMTQPPARGKAGEDNTRGSRDE